MLVSVVLNVMNEEKNIADLLDSLVTQEGPIEIVVVDANSRDRTREIIEKYVQQYPDIVRMYIKPGSRGLSTNFGISKAKGDIIAFTGGDCIANPFWIKELRKSIMDGTSVVAGKTINMGLKAWEELDRVELFYKGVDLSYPSCNEAFKREVLEKVGGFDTWFITAEDIDLNYRAVDAGYPCWEALTRHPWITPLHREPGFAAVLRRAELARERALAAFREAGGQVLLGLR